jgi:hypothetical protein
MWLLFGILLGLAIMALAFWLRNKAIAVRWYEWLLGGLGLALLLFSIQNYFAATKEFEPFAPGMFIMVFGLPGTALVLMAVCLSWWRHFRKNRSVRNNARGETHLA